MDWEKVATNPAGIDSEIYSSLVQMMYTGYFRFNPDPDVASILVT